MTQRGIKQTIADRDAVLTMLVAHDRYAVAALARGDDAALLRRITKQNLGTDALNLAVERALMRGCGNLEICRAASLGADDLHAMIAAIYSRMNA